MNTQTTKAKQLKYAQLIDQSQQALQEEEKAFKVESARLDLEASINVTKRDLALAKKALDASQKASPYSVQKESELTDKVEGLQKGLDFAEKILKERF